MSEQQMSQSISGAHNQHAQAQAQPQTQAQAQAQGSQRNAAGAAGATRLTW